MMKEGRGEERRGGGEGRGGGVRERKDFVCKIGWEGKGKGRGGMGKRGEDFIRKK